MQQVGRNQEVGWWKPKVFSGKELASLVKKTKAGKAAGESRRGATTGSRTHRYAQAARQLPGINHQPKCTIYNR